MKTYTKKQSILRQMSSFAILLGVLVIIMSLIPFFETAYAADVLTQNNATGEKSALMAALDSADSGYSVLDAESLGSDLATISSGFNYVNSTASSTASTAAFAYSTSSQMQLLDDDHSGMVHMAGGTVMVITGVLALMIFEFIFRGRLKGF